MRLTNGDVLFNWPLAQHVLTAGWLYSDGNLHRAIDLRAAVGTPVYAAEGGTVSTAYTWNGKVTKGDTNSYGNMVKLRHADYQGGKLETLYAHLSKLCVAQGQQVKEGDLIGYSGNTGNSSGPHLHFEVRWNGERRNPLVWLDDDFTTANAKVYTYGAGQAPAQRPVAAGIPGVDVSKYQGTVEPAAQLQKLCVVNASAALIDKAKALGLPVENAACTLIGPASNGDAMTIWQAAQAEGNPYFASYTED